jgi:nucleotide-binding universal stress UspA family protein
MERIVVAIDGSEAARQALRWAVDEGRRRQATVDVVHVWHFPTVNPAPNLGDYQPAAFEKAAEELIAAELGAMDTEGVSVETHLLSAPAVSSILEAAKGADLLVVGSRGRGGFMGLLLGSVSNQIVHHATCPVVVIPAPGR